MDKYEIHSTETFDVWIDGLKDDNTRTAIFRYIDRMADGNLGKTKSVGDGIMENKINIGPGYRIYFTRTGRTILLLLCGGDKSTQQRDIRQAKQLKQEV
ncbi:MAG: type II toxin-antitoxin system RelE/ParE family toxin [Rickettsiales bacterium]|jgi:putative addiction module killer protein|nr:type II toxin-antitoxin system RelE/ParE family toxin [Rickettsiales bacterium]